MDTYDRKAFVLAYANANDPDITDPKPGGYFDAVRTHRAELLAGLERLFELELTAEAAPDPPLFLLFRATARSYLAITGPMSGFLEAGLIHKRLEQVGAHEVVLRDMGRITEINAESKAAHLDILDTLVAHLLGDRADRVFTVDDLAAIGVSTTPPSHDDYDWVDEV
ncbi:hypothetical protein [Actinokineospora diospyrosa]|uniref:Uncharacterized protein n=1 Tax=Actinokineospora diospyrosa TaxID=103728 RepID=A0ABT1IH59_9PSEU|nr:hypothetical protein [Actinokineospora diospyrosa]MCP2271896.1 hypothetical protein [Actinokineospora diospyrosa]